MDAFEHAVAGRVDLLGETQGFLPVSRGIDGHQGAADKLLGGVAALPGVGGVDFQKGVVQGVGMGQAEIGQLEHLVPAPGPQFQAIAFGDVGAHLQNGNGAARGVAVENPQGGDIDFTAVLGEFA